MNKFDQLVTDMQSGEITLRDLDIATMVWIQKHPILPEGVKNLLVQPGSGGGLIRGLFAQIRQTIGHMELAYRRGEQKYHDKPKNIHEPKNREHPSSRK